MSGFAYLSYQDEFGVPNIEGATEADRPIQGRDRQVRDVDEIKDFDHSAVDFDQLQRFTMGNRSLEEEVLNLFRTQSVLYVERLRAAADDLAWLEAAHTLKGSAAGIGAHKVREAALECENLTGGDRTAKGEAALVKLQDSLNEANLLISTFLND